MKSSERNCHTKDFFKLIQSSFQSQHEVIMKCTISRNISFGLNEVTLHLFGSFLLVVDWVDESSCFISGQFSPWLYMKSTICCILSLVVCCITHVLISSGLKWKFMNCDVFAIVSPFYSVQSYIRTVWLFWISL